VRNIKQRGTRKLRILIVSWQRYALERVLRRRIEQNVKILTKWSCMKLAKIFRPWKHLVSQSVLFRRLTGKCVIKVSLPWLLYPCEGLCHHFSWL
jgi:hypothetical protein